MQRKFYIPFGEAPSQSIDYLLGIIYDARSVTLRLTEGISREELHWQYAEGWNTIGALLSHIISCDIILAFILSKAKRLQKKKKKNGCRDWKWANTFPNLSRISQ